MQRAIALEQLIISYFCASLAMNLMQIKEKNDQCGFPYLKCTDEQVNEGSEAHEIYFW
jgi:hypothetical protein